MDQAQPDNISNPIGTTIDKGEVKPLFSNGKQVDWHIPKDLYRRLRSLHEWALDKQKLQTPDSEHLFALMMIDDAVSRGEKIRAAYEKSQQLIVEPGGVLI